ncbi:MAG: hypothetical protein SGARI_005884, partial [Bacillariaceae sp.]
MVESTETNAPNSSRMSQASPLKAAATLIQTLEIAQTEMTSFAADAARDAENARRNARAAQEIARRYQNRSYPKVKSSFDDINVSALSRKSTKITKTATSIGNNNDNSRLTIHSTTASTAVTPRPKPPKMKTFYSHQGPQDERHDDVKQDILAITAELKTPPERHAENGGKKRVSSANTERDSLQSQPTNTTIERKTRGFQTASSVERIAQHHADELLQLSLELEKTKQALKSEQRQHQDCKMAFGSMQSKAKSLEQQNQKLLEQLQEEKRISAQRVSSLEHDLEESLSKVQAAEEDAELALDLAKESSEEKKQMEDELESALNEIEKLKAFTGATMNG